MNTHHVNLTAHRLQAIADALDYMGIDPGNCYVDPVKREVVFASTDREPFDELSAGYQVELYRPWERSRWFSAKCVRDGITFICDAYRHESEVEQPQPPTLCGPAE